MAPVVVFAARALVTVVSHLFKDFRGVELLGVGLEFGASERLDFLCGKTLNCVVFAFFNHVVGKVGSCVIRR